MRPYFSGNFGHWTLYKANNTPSVILLKKMERTTSRSRAELEGLGTQTGLEGPSAWAVFLLMSMQVRPPDPYVWAPFSFLFLFLFCYFIFELENNDKKSHWIQLNL